MNNTIVIAFLLVSTSFSLNDTGVGYPGGYGRGPEPNPVWLTPNLFFSFKRPASQGRIGEDPAETMPSAGNYRAWWIVLGVLLLILPLYLHFMVRKRQAMARQIELLEADVTLLFHHAPCGYHAMDERGYFIDINRTLLNWLGYEKEDIVGKLKFVDVIEGGSAIAEEKIAVLLHGDFSGNVSISLVRKNGEKLPVMLKELSGDGIRRDGSKRLFSTIDNTECQKAFDRIRNLDQELESFSYSISHDLRAPLRSIDGYSKIMQEDYATSLGEEGRRVLSVIMNNAKRMGKLIDDLLEFGRLGRKTMQRSYVNMTAIVNSILQDLTSQEQHRKIDVHLGELHPAFADSDMIRQVWLNLLENAFKYTGKKDSATIEIRSFKIGKGELCYEVKDNGVGFDMKYAPKLFGVFQRLHKIQDFTGTGVGLAIVKRIISRHGGKVWAEGSLENGAIFYFTIPIEDDDT